MAAGTDHERGRDGIVYDPTAVDLLHRLQRFSKSNPRAGALQQIVIEFAAADAIANRFVVARFDFRAVRLREIDPIVDPWAAGFTD